MSLLKKLLVALITLGVLFAAAAVAIPLLVDVDKYRPQIEQAVNDRINGKFELGRLGLSLWGQIRVEVAGVKLADRSGNPVLAVSDAHFHVPFSSVFSGAPILTFKAEKPSVNLVKGKDGKLNALGLLKPSTPAPSGDGAASPAPTQEPTRLPGLVSNARLGVELRQAVVTYRDDATQLANRLDLNVLARDISLSRPTEVEIWGDLSTKMGKTLALKGPARVTARILPKLAGAALESVGVTAKADLDGLDVRVTSQDPAADANAPARPGDLFRKRPGIPANGELVLSATPREARVEKLVARFHNAELTATGTISSLAPSTPASAAPVGAAPSAATPGAAASPVPPAPPASSGVASFEVRSNEIALAPWSELVPMLKDYELGGSARFDGAVNGPSDKLGYRGKLVLAGVTAKAPKLKGAPRVDGSISVSTDQVDAIELAMKAPGNDLRVTGKVVSFAAPRIDLQVASTGLDLNQLVELPPLAKPGAKPAAPAAGGPPGGAPGAGSPAGPAAASDYDALLEPLRRSKLAAAAVATVGVSVASLKAYDYVLADVTGRLTLKDLIAGVEGLAFRMFSGAVTLNASANLRPATPTYSFGTKVAGLDLKKAVEANVEMFRNTLVGRADLEVSGNGASFNPEPAKKALRARGWIKVADAVFATIDVGRMATEAINGAIERIAEKVPQVKGKSVKGLPDRASRYELVSSSFSIENGKLSAPDFVGRAVPKAGIDLKGSTTLGMVDSSLAASWEIIDTHDLTRAKEISVEVGGVRVENILAEKGQPVRFPVTVGGTLLEPKYRYAEAPAFLAKVALNNTTGAAKGFAKQKAKEELKKQADALIQKAPGGEKVQEALKGLGKKLFGR